MSPEWGEKIFSSRRGKMILSGDIGGTNTRLALFDLRSGYKKISEAHFHSHNYSGLLDVLKEYLGQEKPQISQACFAVAGPIHDGVCRMTNLSWIIDSEELEKKLNVPVFLINDLEANAWGLRVLSPEDFFLLQKGKPRQFGNAALISAGTGLGEAGLYWDGSKHHPFACEGGHSDFAPRDSLEVELFYFLQKIHSDHVSYERVVSGSGLHSIYKFLIESGHEEKNEEIQREMKEKDPAFVISEWGQSKRDRACTRALALFISFYGAEAGNVALKFLAMGGVFIGGGIAPKLLDEMKKGIFIESFLSKGRFRALLEKIPVRVVLNDETALLGAAAYVHTKK
jgi:glucokinase